MNVARLAKAPAARKVRLGTIHVDVVGFDEAIDAIDELVAARRGGYVVTPNVDHVVLAESDPGLRAAYAGASLSLADGMPLLWISRAMGHPLPEKVSGSDLIRPVAQRAAREGWRVYLLGAAPGVGAMAAERLRAENPGLVVAGVDAPPLGFERDPAQLGAVIARANAAAPDVVFVALGCPKQELFMASQARELAPAVLLGIGASLDFVAGTIRRAPRWMSRAGLEWLFRLSQDPKRLAHRYLVRDRAIAKIVWRMMRTPREQRAYGD